MLFYFVVDFESKHHDYLYKRFDQNRNFFVLFIYIQEEINISDTGVVKAAVDQ